MAVLEATPVAAVAPLESGGSRVPEVLAAAWLSAALLLIVLAFFAPRLEAVPGGYTIAFRRTEIAVVGAWMVAFVIVAYAIVSVAA